MTELGSTGPFFVANDLPILVTRHKSRNEALVHRCVVRDDSAAFKLLLDRYHDIVFRIAASILGPRLSSDIDDVVQEVFVRIHRGLASFRADAKFSTWTYRIAYNQSLSHKQRFARFPTHVGADQLLDVGSREGDPTTALDNAQLRTVLNAAIDRLPTEYQVAVRLFYWFQVPIAEIAEQLGTPENSIKSYLHRARKLLASDLVRQKDL